MAGNEEIAMLPCFCRLQIEEDNSELNTDGSHNHASAGSLNGSEDSEMESFESFLPKVESLLHSVGLDGFLVEPIHHGYIFQNCVYALKSSTEENEMYILRVPNYPGFYSEDEAGELDQCQAVINDAALLEHLAGQLPVPRVKAYSATRDNPLGTPYTVQTRIPGKPLDAVYADMSQAQKLGLVDQVVELLAKHESVTFANAGTIAAASGSPAFISDFHPSSRPSVNIFNEGEEAFVKEARTVEDRQGSSIKSLLVSHVNGWIAKEHTKLEVHSKLYLPLFNGILAMIEEMDSEGYFNDEPYPIVLYHWDLEPRNIMVEEHNGEWNVTGVIDWDDSVAVPRPLARKPLSWIWDFNPETFTGYLDVDHHTNPTEDPSRTLSEEDLALKAQWDAKAAGSFSNYIDDAYGRGRWWRRIWFLIRFEIHQEWYLDLATWLLQEWSARHELVRPQPEKLSGLWRKTPAAREHFEILELNGSDEDD